VTAVVLLHGFPQTSAAWRDVVPALADAGFDVLTPDLRGADLVDQLLAVLPAEPCHLVGHDIGALAAWRLAAANPDSLLSLTAVSAPHPKAFARANAGEGGSDQAQRTFYLDHFKAPGAADIFLADEGAGIRRLFAASEHTGDVEAHVAALVQPGVLDDALGWYRADHPADVADIAVRTMFVWGDRDTVVSPEAARFTADHVSGEYRFEVLEGVGHWVPELAPRELADLLVSFL
jgi:pimeloyl-ACP methyl ester carboxylesterase